MKTSATIMAMLLVASAAFAQDSPASAETRDPDYSRDSLLWLLSELPPQPEVEPPLRFHVGAVSFRALGSDWQFVYLPIMMPLSGSGFTTTREWPDPFALTGTQIATSPRAWRTQRTVNAEMRRIELTERAKLRVVAGSGGAQ